MRSFGFTRSFAGKAGKVPSVGGDAVAAGRAAAGRAGQIVGDATQEMKSFKELYLFIGGLLHPG